ncbi:MAG: prepilin-type N-terminal cleavage/methylation domain-containing protein [Planctomycetota bacterium]
MRRGGFTLLETLAAVAILGLLAITVVPMLRQLGQRTLSERVQAQHYLKTLAPHQNLVAGTMLTISDHPNWRLRINDLIAEPEPPRSPGFPAPVGPTHRWLLVSIHASDNNETLAETIMAVIDPSAAP